MRLARELKQRIDQLAAIGTVATTVGQSLDLDRTLATALQTVLDIVDAEAGGISLIDYEVGELVLRAQQGWSQDFVKNRSFRIPLGQGMSGEVLQKDDVVVYDELNGTEPLAVQSFHDEHFRSIAMAPMHALGFAARSARSHVSCGEPTPQPPISPQFVFRNTMCHAPMSML